MERRSLVRDMKVSIFALTTTIWTVYPRKVVFTLKWPCRKRKEMMDIAQSTENIRSVSRNMMSVLSMMRVSIFGPAPEAEEG